MNEQIEWKKRELTKPLTFSTVFRSLLIQYKIDFIYISTNANATNSLLLPSFRFYLLTSAYFIRCARAISFVLYSSTSILCAMVVVFFFLGNFLCLYFYLAFSICCWCRCYFRFLFIFISCCCCCFFCREKWRTH